MTVLTQAAGGGACPSVQSAERSETFRPVWTLHFSNCVEAFQTGEDSTEPAGSSGQASRITSAVVSLKIWNNM